MKKKRLLLPLAPLLLLLFLCLMAPILSPYDPNQLDTVSKFLPPSTLHPLGTDYLGRDLLSRLLWGGRTTLGYAAMISIFSMAIGTFIGIFSGWMGGIIAKAVIKSSDILRSFPNIVLVMIFMTFWGANMLCLSLALILTRWIWYARVSSTITLLQKKRPSILASQLVGCKTSDLLIHHIFPAILPQLSSIFFMDFGHTLLAISGYSFLGFGVLPPQAEWGAMIRDGQNYLSHPEMMLWPGLCILVVVLSTNTFGDYIRDLWEEMHT